MTEMATFLLVLPIAVFAGMIGGTVGFGSAIILIPVCSYVFGPAETVPIITVAALLGNMSRTAFSWRETDWLAAGIYCLGAVPAAAAGALVFVEIDEAAIKRLLGLFILAAVPAGRLTVQAGWQIRLWHFLPVGVIMGALSGLVGSSGPVNAPFFLAYGLVKGAYLATEAVGAAAVHLTKSVVYGSYAALDRGGLTTGLLLGAGLVGGSYIGKRIVGRMDVSGFRLAVEAMLAGAGIVMLAGYA